MSSPQSGWQGKTDGTSWMHKSLISVMRFTPLGIMYIFTWIFVVPFYLIFSNSFRPIYFFYHKRLKYSKTKAFFATYRNFCRFSTIVIDKFNMFAGGKYNFEIENMRLYEDLASSETGFLMLSAHVGNYEAAGFYLKATDKRFNALVYAGEAETIMNNRKKIFDDNNINMIPVRNDMSHLILLNSALENGESVSIPADRIVGNQKTLTCNFLDTETKFPAGAFSLAEKRKLPVLSVHVMKTGLKKYHIYIKRIDSTKKNAQNIADAFSEHLEEIVRKYPYQWFNYFDFWNEIN